MKGLSGQVRLFPVVFDKGSGCTMEDVDGNKYIDFSSGIYVTTLGHCHPKVSEAVARAADTLMNAHDFTTPVKVRLLEKMAEVLPGDLKGYQLYDLSRFSKERGILLMADEVLTSMGRTGKWLCLEHWDVIPDVVTLGKGFGNGFPVTAMVVREEYADAVDTSKPINWKRIIQFNGEYGCTGDLGMHVTHVPFRAGWVPQNVRSILSDLVPTRPDGKGGTAPCETWDNATLLCETLNPVDGKMFPWTVKIQRIAPGQKDTWYCEVLGMKKSARYSSKNTNSIEILDYTTNKDQAWQQIDMGHETAFKSITAGIFEFGFSDSILQMWAAYLYELVHGKPLKKFAGCVTCEETALNHKLLTAALESHRERTTVEIDG